jgi:hypothetical protein
LNPGTHSTSHSTFHATFQTQREREREHQESEREKRAAGRETQSTDQCCYTETERRERATHKVIFRDGEEDEDEGGEEVWRFATGK